MDTKVSTFRNGQQHGRLPAHFKPYTNKVCQFWLKGNCNRNPCRFLHRELPIPTSTSKREFPPPAASSSNVYRRRSPPQQSNHLHLVDEEISRKRKTSSNSNYDLRSSLSSRTSNAPNKKQPITQNNNIQASTPPKCTEIMSTPTKPCQDWMSGHCVNDKCQFLHSWSTGDSFSMLGQLKGHTKVICGVALPSGSDMLFSASNDGMLNGWDCHTCQLTRTINLGEEIGCLIGEGPWMFAGLQNSIKVWNFQTKMEYTLGKQNEAFGLVNAIVIGDDDMLFTGGQDGSIMVWKANNDNLNPFELAATLKGHTAPVTCLIFGRRNRLYSGSTDGTIRVWDLERMKCLFLLKEHTDAVTSLICWKESLLSSSLDNKIKAWGTTVKDTLEVVYTHDLKHAPIVLRGIDDEEKNPILLCSCDDNCVRLFDLPSFKVRGELYSRDEVRTMEPGPSGFFFTGDALGTVSVCKLAESSSGQQATA